MKRRGDIKNFIKRNRVDLVLIALNMPWVVLFAKQFYEVYIAGGF